MLAGKDRTCLPGPLGPTFTTTFPKLNLSLVGSVTQGGASYVLIKGAQQILSGRLLLLAIADIAPHLRHDTAIAALSFEPAVQQG